MNSGKFDDSEYGKLRHIFEETPEPVLTAVEVAAVMGITQQAAHAKLARAHDEGVIERKKVGSRAVVWWPSNQASDSA